MPQTASAKKALRSAARRRVINDAWRTKFRTKLREMRDLLLEKNSEKAKEALPGLFSAIDRAAKHRIFHTNRAARIKARVSTAVNKLSA